MTHVLNPYSGRMITMNGATHKRMISLGLMDEYGQAKSDSKAADSKAADSKARPSKPSKAAPFRVKKYKIAPPPRASSPDSIEETETVDDEDAYDDE